ncbi:peptidoglycan DD-metalloendopeptidase family protein [Modestobacter altitudinis]|uniref:peptidoglycan DD-metalloendopeptidase family protein n=1 Tax=Modestobacter altitudinis TaxID=2213158 RepID=UPI001485FF42|nr:M23 family metallopeptidase [Modestobacter altitudinis]
MFVGVLPGQALAAPANPSDGDIASAQSAQQAAADEVGRIAALVASAESDLQRVTGQAEAANDAYLVAQGDLEEAQQAAAETAAALQAANEAVAAAQADVATLGRENYMRGGSISGVTALLSAEGPSELMEQAAVLGLLGDQRAAVLDQLEVAQTRQAEADSQAKAAVADKDEAAQETAQAKATADAQVSTFQAAVQSVSTQKATYEKQLQDAQVNLLALQGQRNAYQAWKDQQAQQQAAEAAQAAASAKAAAQAAARARQAAEQPTAPTPTAPKATAPKPTNGTSTQAASVKPMTGGGGVAPTSGRFTTCFEMRWGTMHNGVDIAAPIGTPIYAPAAGRVVRAGTATGYGLAVYIQHDDGSVTVYGHINDYFVSVGQRVSAGEVIAEVGNRGESTGPHLHFQVNTKGMYAGAVNPITWLAARGVDMGGRC